MLRIGNIQEGAETMADTKEGSAEILVALGETIRAQRHRAGLTQAELAELAGIGRLHLHHVESGRRNPTVLVLVNLAKGLGVPAGELLGDVSAARTS